MTSHDPIAAGEPALLERIVALQTELAQCRRDHQTLHNAHLASPVAQLDLDANGVVLFASARAAQLLRVESTQVLAGRPLVELFADGQGTALLECFHALQSQPEDEKRCTVRGPGRRGCSAVWLRAVFTRHPDVSNCSLVLTDITDMELRHRELSADVGLLETLFEVAEVEFFEMQAGHDFRCSRGYAQMVGISPDSAVPNSFKEWGLRIHPLDRTRMQQRWETTPSGHLPSADYRVIADDGRVIWLRSASILRRAADGQMESISGAVRDVSAEYAARQLLAERAALLELIPDILIQIAPDGEITYLNAVAAKFFRESGLGAMPSRLEQIPFVQRHPHEAQAHVRAVIGRGERIRFSFVGAGHPNQPMLDVLANPILGEQNEIVGALIVARDVSRLAEAELEARKSLLRLQTLVETARASILMVDADGRVILANRAFCTFADCSSEQAVGAQMERFCFAQDYEQRRAAVRDLMASGSARFEWRVKCADGNERWLQVDGSTFSEGHGQRLQFVFVGIDIESARQERQALIDRERWLDRVLDDAGIGAFRIDRERGVAQIVGAYSRLYQQQAAHFVREDELMSLILPEHRQRFRREIDAFVAREGRTKVDYPLEFADGTRRWLRAFLRNEGAADAHTGTLSSVVLDITEDQARNSEREELQRQVYQTQKTESLGVMAGGIAHDLNNMLMAAIGQLNLAVAVVAPETALGQYLATVESVLGRMEGLTERMLAYAGKSASRMEPVEIGSLLDTMEPLLRASSGRFTRLRSEIVLRPLLVRGDSTQIEQVILNFVQNAVDAIGERGGNVRLRAGALDASDVRVSTLQWPLGCAERYLELTIRDDGPGMDDVTMRRIFEPFYTTKTTGRGLGLSVVQGIVKAHGGSIKILSEVGIGTEFRVYLPLIDQPMIVSKDDDHDSSQFDPGQRRLLAVDDDEDVLAITVVMLEQIGFEVAAFLSGDDAIAEFASQPGCYACAVVDLTMPVKDGAGVVRELRALEPHLPVLFVSGYSRQQAAELAAEDEHTRFLRKPFRIEALRRALDLLLRKAGVQ